MACAQLISRNNIDKKKHEVTMSGVCIPNIPFQVLIMVICMRFAIEFTTTTTTDKVFNYQFCNGLLF